MNKVIENYSDANNWYRVYDDGWIEQGGKISTSVISRGSVALTFPRAFTSAPVSIDTTIIAPRTGDGSGYEFTITALTSTGVSLLFDTTSAYGRITGFYWTAKGY